MVGSHCSMAAFHPSRLAAVIKIHPKIDLDPSCKQMAGPAGHAGAIIFLSQKKMMVRAFGRDVSVCSSCSLRECNSRAGWSLQEQDKKQGRNDCKNCTADQTSP